MSARPWLDLLVIHLPINGSGSAGRLEGGWTRTGPGPQSSGEPGVPVGEMDLGTDRYGGLDDTPVVWSLVSTGQPVGMTGYGVHAPVGSAYLVQVGGGRPARVHAPVGRAPES